MYAPEQSEPVILCEVGPRDGFQFEDKPIPTERKLDIIRRLAAAGLRRIQVTSFVHPRLVPQMADAGEVVAALASEGGAGAGGQTRDSGAAGESRRLDDVDGGDAPDDDPAASAGDAPEAGVVSNRSRETPVPAAGPVRFSALALNRRGVERAANAGVRYIDLSIATNEKHSRDNANMTVEEGVAEAEAMIDAAVEAGMDVQLGLQTVFGYAAPGDTPLDLITRLVERFSQKPLESLSLADTTGLANPVLIRNTVAAVREVLAATSLGLPLVLHLHDTRGLGLANVTAALACGVRRFDTSVGGLGGCPFIPGATGNIPTEDTAYLLESMGETTGVDYKAVSAVARELEGFLGRALPGRVHGVG